MAFWDRDALPGWPPSKLRWRRAGGHGGSGFHYWTVRQGDDAIGAVDLSDIDGQSAWIGFAFRRDTWARPGARSVDGGDR